MRARLEGGLFDGKAISRATTQRYGYGEIGYAPLEIEQFPGGDDTIHVYAWNRRTADGVHIYVFSHAYNSHESGSW
jgi:hypothetical protein